MSGLPECGTTGRRSVDMCKASRIALGVVLAVDSVVKAISKVPDEDTIRRMLA